MTAGFPTRQMSGVSKLLLIDLINFSLYIVLFFTLGKCCEIIIFKVTLNIKILLIGFHCNFKINDQFIDIFYKQSVLKNRYKLKASYFTQRTHLFGEWCKYSTDQILILCFRAS